MRKESCSNQLRLENSLIEQVQLSPACRDAIVKVLRSLQKVHSKPEVTERIKQQVGCDIRDQTSADRGGESMDCWHIVVLAGLRLGCNYTYDRLQDLAENHIKLRAIMGIGDWNEYAKFNEQTIRDNLCRLSPQTINEIIELFRAEGHKIRPSSIERFHRNSS